jgi:FAD/FMN-containing dehydrogenase
MVSENNPAPSASPLAPEDTAGFARGLAGAVILPDDEAYGEARLVWNGMIDRRPALIVRPRNAEDISQAVRFARLHQLQVAVRGGGHNVAGLGTSEGGMVIDLSQMKQVQVDPHTRRVRVGGGATLGELDHATQAHGLAVPAGVVSDTGIAGLTLGGGLGWLRDKFGTTADNLVGAEIVTAGGEVIQASESENADLLWGLRGGGGNFGIVTTFEFQAHPVGPEVMFVFVFHDGERMKEALQFYRQYLAGKPDEVSTLAFAGVFPPGAEMFPEHLHGRPFIAFGAMYAGPVEAGRTALQPLRDFVAPLADFSDVMPYTQAQTIFDEDYPAHKMRYYWKSLNLMSLDDEVIDRFVEHARRQPSPYSTTDLWPIGGAVRRFGSDHAAYFGRQAAFLMNPEANWISPQDDTANIQWVREFVEAMGQFSDGSRYLNFAGFQEEGDKMMKSAFGSHYPRLARLKAKYDPENFFRLNQNILPAG